MIYERILRAFSTEGAFLRARRYDAGHINDTYVASFAGENGERRYVLQRVNRRVFPDVPGVMANIARVTEHLAGKTLTLIPTIEGATFHTDSEGEYWRLYDFVREGRALDRPATMQEAFVAARTFGEFTRALADLPGPPLNETIPRFHDTEHRVEKLLASIDADSCNRAGKALDVIAHAEHLAPLSRRLQEIHASSGACPRVVHNDTKINNVILSRSGRGGTVIDLDTVMPGYPLYDVGDLLRTAATTAPEDEIHLPLVGVRPDYAEAICRGYREGIGDAMSAGEAEHMVTAAAAITFETGVRFLTDYLDGDRYFRIHHPAHNIDRARNQFALASAFMEYECTRSR